MGRYTIEKPWIMTYVGSNKTISKIAAERRLSINDVLLECQHNAIDPVEVFKFDPFKERDVSTHWVLGYVNSGKSILEIAKEQKISESDVLSALISAGKQQKDLEAPAQRFVGLDVGTSRLIVARRATDKNAFIHAQRNAFLELDSSTSTLRSLKRQKVNYVEMDNRMFIVGNDAYDYGNVFPHLELKRPMQNGMLSIEPNSLPVIKEIIGNLTGHGSEGSICAYSIPAVPVDVPKLVQYHTDVIEGILELYGYKAFAVNEGVAVANVGLEPYDLTGLALSFGGGLINACLMFKGLSALQISVSQAGDFIDGMAAKDLGMAPIQVNAIKESGEIDISKTQTTREGQAIKSYYMFCIRHALTEIAKYFNNSSEKPHFSEPIHIACAGGGVLINGFSEVFEKEFKALNMPFKVADNGVFLVDDPLTATARGCLIEAELSI